MTSLDGDGSTHSDKPVGNGDHDPVRLSPPADPWLTEAPTSVVGDAATLRDAAAPPADTAPLTDTAPFAAAGGFGHPGAGRKQRDRRSRDRRVRRLAFAAVILVIVVAAGLLAIDGFGSGDDPQASGPSRGVTPASTPAAGAQPSAPPSTGAGTARPTAGATGNRPAASATVNPAVNPNSPADVAAAPAAPEVVYEVTASGSRNTGSVEYIDEDGEIIRLSGVPLPWRTTFPTDDRRMTLVLDAQRKGGGDNGPVTCTITVGGKVVAATTAEGKYAFAMCTGSS